MLQREIIERDLLALSTPPYLAQYLARYLEEITDVISNGVVSTRVELKANSSGTYFLEEGSTYSHGGRSGWFAWDATVPIATHQADTEEGVFVAPNATAIGAFERIGWLNGVRPTEFGAVVDGHWNSSTWVWTDDLLPMLACLEFCRQRHVPMLGWSGNLCVSAEAKAGPSFIEPIGYGKILNRSDRLLDATYFALLNETNLNASREYGFDIRCGPESVLVPMFTGTADEPRAVFEINSYPRGTYNSCSYPSIAPKEFIDPDTNILSTDEGGNVPLDNGLIGFSSPWIAFSKVIGRSYGMGACGAFGLIPYFGVWDVIAQTCGQGIHLLNANGTTVKWLSNFCNRGFVGDGDRIKLIPGTEQNVADITIFAGDTPYIDVGYMEDVGSGPADFTGMTTLTIGARRRILTVTNTTGFLPLGDVSCSPSGAELAIYSVASGISLIATCKEGSPEPANGDTVTQLDDDGDPTAVTTSITASISVQNTVQNATVMNARLYNQRTGKLAARLFGANVTFINGRVSNATPGRIITDITSAGILINTDFPEDNTNLPIDRFPRITWEGIFSLVFGAVNNASFLKQKNAAGTYIDLAKIDSGDRFSVSAAKGMILSGPRPTISLPGEYLVIAPDSVQAGDIAISFYIPAGLTGDYITGNFRADVIGNHSLRCFNYQANVSANARLYIETLSTGGDPFLLIAVSGGTSWSIGADNSDSDKFKISNAASPSGGSDRIVIDANVVSFPTLPPKLPSFTVAGAPNAATVGAGAMIYVSNESGGAVPAFSDATNWLRVTDRAVIS